MINEGGYIELLINGANVLHRSGTSGRIEHYGTSAIVEGGSIAELWGYGPGLAIVRGGTVGRVSGAARLEQGIVHQWDVALASVPGIIAGGHVDRITTSDSGAELELQVEGGTIDILEIGFVDGSAGDQGGSIRVVGGVIGEVQNIYNATLIMEGGLVEESVRATWSGGDNLSNHDGVFDLSGGEIRGDVRTTGVDVFISGGEIFGDVAPSRNWFDNVSVAGGWVGGNIELVAGDLSLGGGRVDGDIVLGAERAAFIDLVPVNAELLGTSIGGDIYLGWDSHLVVEGSRFYFDHDGDPATEARRIRLADGVEEIVLTPDSDLFRLEGDVLRLGGLEVFLARGGFTSFDLLASASQQPSEWLGSVTLRLVPTPAASGVLAVAAAIVLRRRRSATYAN